MCLDCSYNAFHGAYSAFNRLRQAVCAAAGGSFPPHAKGTVIEGTPCTDDGRWYIPDSVTRSKYPGLYEFLCHEDCEGWIAPDMCAKVADDLEALLPKLDVMGADYGHIARDGGVGAVARRFIAGCRAAYADGKPLVFA